MRQARATKLEACALLLWLSLALTGCGGGNNETPDPSPQPPQQPTPVPPVPPAPPPPPPPPPPSGALLVREVSPTATNQALTQFLSPYQVVVPNSENAVQVRLFVFLPGTGIPPSAYRQFLRYGAERGWHTVGLSYPNTTAVRDTCRGSPDIDCEGKVRRETLTGEDVSPLVQVERHDSILRRLESLLKYLEATYPAEGWSQYTTSGQINWSRLTMAGHSQGAGHAAYLGKMHGLDRIVMFAGPSDLGTGGDMSPRWLASPNITPASLYYGFIHADDAAVPFSVADSNWIGLGLGEFGPVVNVDSVGWPYGNSRRLVTRVQTSSRDYHGAIVIDGAGPVDTQGHSQYWPVWNYLAFPG
jgi:hypothetical protein